MAEEKREVPRRVILADGGPGLEYSSGLVKDARNGLIVRPAESSVIRSSARGREVSEARWARAREAADRAIMESAPDGRRTTGLQRMVESQINIVHNPLERGSDRTKAAEFVFRAGGYLEDRRTNPGTVAGAVIQVNIGSQLVEGYASEVEEDSTDRSH